MFTRKAVLGAAVAAAAALFSAGSQAAVGDTYQDTFQGVTFTFVETSTTTLTFELSGTLPLSPDWDTAAYFGAFDLKDLGSTLNFSTDTGTATGPGIVGTLDGINSQLSAASVDCSGMGSPPGSICFDIAPDYALGNPGDSFDLLYTITFTGGTLDIADTGPHLQVVFTAIQDGAKVGSLYSLNVPLCEECGGPPTEIPEPGSLALIGLGLGFAGYIGSRRRKKL